MKTSVLCAIFLAISSLSTVLAVQNGDLRLTGYMSSRRAGRLEIYLGGGWHHFCNERFDMSVAHVACRQMRFGLAMMIVDQNNNRNGFSRFGIPPDNATITITDISCHGSEKHLLNCNYTRDENANCGRIKPVELFCSEFYAHPTAGDVRLLEGESRSRGILEVYYDGVWQRPCIAGFNRTGADTVCQQLGYTSSVRDPEFVTREFQTEILGGTWSCSRPGVCVSSCFAENKEGMCNSHDDTIVTCNHSGKRKVPRDEICSFPNSGRREYSVRLVGGKQANEGILEIYIGGVWGTVCGASGGFSDATAEVVCKQLGYVGFSKLHKQARSVFGNASTKAHFSNVRCDGGEYALYYCDTDNVTECQQDDLVGITCSTNYSQSPYGSIGLYQSSGAFGLLLVYKDGRFGGVCDSGFTTATADVACRQMGYLRSRSIAYESYYDINNEIKTAVLSNISCKGDENSLLDCYHDDTPRCNHKNLVGLRCVASELQQFGKVRLTQGNTTSGILEYGYGGVWYQICPASILKRSLNIACRQLGFDGYHNFSTATVLSTKPLLTFERCVGFEKHLDDCILLPIPTVISASACPNPLQASCRPKPLAEISSLRLVTPDNGSKVGPTVRHYGVLEVYQYGRWGIVCADRFPENAGDIACQQLGFAGLSELTLRTPHEGDNLDYNILTTSCRGDEAKLADCATDLEDSPDCTTGAVYLRCREERPVPTTKTIELTTMLRTTSTSVTTTIKRSEAPPIGLIVGVILGVLFVAAAAVVIVFVLILLKRYYRNKKLEKVEADWVPGSGANNNIDFHNPRYEEPAVALSVGKSPAGPPPAYSIA